MLWDAVIGTEDNGEGGLVAEGLESIDELMEDGMPLQVRDVLHADDMRLHSLREPSEMTEQAPLLIGSGIKALGISREGLAWCTSDQNTPAIIWVQGGQFFDRDIANALLLEGGWAVVVFVWITAFLRDIVAGNDLNPCIKKASRQTTNTAEQVDRNDAFESGLLPFGIQPSWSHA